MRTKAFRADAILLLVAAIWGSGFVAQRAAMEHMGPLAFNAIRYAMGSALLGLFFMTPHRRRGLTPHALRAGILLGAIMAAASVAQQVGLVTTTASRGGFITGLYVLGVPAVGLLFGQRSNLGHLFGALLAAIGLWLLAGDLSGGFRAGDLWVLACAVLWSFHVVLVAHLAPRSDAFALALVQFIVVTIASGALLALSSTGLLDSLHLGEHTTIAGIVASKWSLLYSGVFAIAIAFTLQIVAQRDAPATHAAILMSMEAVFAVAFGMWLLHETLSPSELAGCGLMFGGMVVTQVWPHKRTPAEKAELRDPVR